jgi:MoaA/NifB/PqqE/SkfB family radical SAM enzyme
MERVDLKVGYQCNNRCLFCIQGDKRFTSPNKSSEEIKKILKSMKKDHDGVVFTGGEPTVRSELINWVNYAKKLGYKTIQIQSNGRMFSYKEYCITIIRAGANEFSPALHGSSAKIHDSLTQAPGSFAQTVAGIKNLRKLNQYILTNSVVTKINYKDLPNLAKLLVDLQVDQFQFAFMHINNIVAKSPPLIKKIVPRYKEAVPYIKKGIDIGIKAGIRVMAEAIPYCFMKGYEKYISEQYIPYTSIFDDKIELADYGSYRANEGKAKGPQCKQCKYNKICEGPWKDYPEIFGWSEFIPFK